MSRRALLKGAAAASLLPGPSLAASPPVRDFRLIPKATRVPLVGAQHPDTLVWAYNATVPGPEIRVRQGERVRIAVDNALAEDTTVHCHGIRLPNAMDGVPHLTQAPIAPGKTFIYEFDVPDAGTYWYHPHMRSAEQVGRGLSGGLIVEERQPIRVDRDIVWVLSDWRLSPDAQIVGDFRNVHDMSHGGRIGNTVTINGKVLETFEVRSGERIRLRLINASNARIYGLRFEGHAPWVIALDGHPVEPHARERIVLGPGMRADLILDCAGSQGSRHRVIDDFYPRRAYHLLDIRYSGEPAYARATPPVPRLPANPVPEPDRSRAERHRVRFEGGMMGRMPMTRMREGMAWTVNRRPFPEHDRGHEPLLTLARGRSCVLELVNDTAWHHPIHLHGHAFRILTRNGRSEPREPWSDTVLLDPDTRAEIAFVADNPGDWMFHCHVLEHQASGMMAVVRVG